MSAFAVTIQAGHVARSWKRLAIPPPRYDAHCLTMAAIESIVAGLYGLTVAQLRFKTRVRYVCWPRQCAMWIMHEKNGIAYISIGRWFNMDHATAIHAIHLIEDLRASDRMVSLEMKQIATKVKAALHRRIQFPHVDGPVGVTTICSRD